MFSIFAHMCSKKTPAPPPGEIHLPSPFETYSKIPFPEHADEDLDFGGPPEEMRGLHRADEIEPPPRVSHEEWKILTARTAPAAPTKRNRPLDMYDECPTRRDLMYDFDDA